MMKGEITKWCEETFGDGEYVYYLDCSNSFTGICLNLSNSKFKCAHFIASIIPQLGC